MAKTLEEGNQPDLADFGGPVELLKSASELGSCSLMPSFLQLALGTLANAECCDRDILAEFICRCLAMATDGFAWTEAVDLLDEARPLPSKIEERCFNRFLAIAVDPSIEPVARAAALDGALRWAIEDRRRQIKLLALLLDVTAEDDPAFLARAAKIMGVAYSHWRESELVERLRILADVKGAADEAAFELGMAKLSDGLEAEERKVAVGSFDAAKYWFLRASEGREQRPDADAYVWSLEVLSAFSRGEGFARLDEMVASLAQDAFQVHHWHADSAEPPWLGARHAEGACWNLLAETLKGLSKHLEEASWWEPAVIVERYVIAAYAAGRSVLNRAKSGGVDALVRPRIEGTIGRREGQAHLLKEWLRHNAGHEWKEEAQSLIGKIEALVVKEQNIHPITAATGWPPIAALLDQARIPSDAKALVREVIANAQSVHFGNLSGAEIDLIDRCVRVVWGCADYRNNQNGRKLFNAVLMWTIRFLNNRLEMTQKDDPGIFYLFEQKDGSLPHENELQADYYRFMFSNVAGAEIEVNNVGGGRADIRFGYGGDRLIAEIKREKSDSSFEGLGKAYSTQTIDYQNVSLRLGFLIVLDQTERRIGGTPHISDLVQPSTVIRKGEMEPRWLVTVKVPGRRFVPSDLTKEAKRAKPKER